MDAGTELMLACVAALRADAVVAGHVDGRIFDRVPEAAGGAAVPYPYISMGPGTSLPDDFDCVASEEVTLQFDVWSSGAGEAFGTVECRKICGAIKTVLHGAALDLAGTALVSLRWEMTRILDDPDPSINHGVVQITALIETP